MVARRNCDDGLPHCCPLALQAPHAYQTDGICQEMSGLQVTRARETALRQSGSSESDKLEQN